MSKNEITDENMENSSEEPVIENNIVKDTTAEAKEVEAKQEETTTVEAKQEETTTVETKQEETTTEEAKQETKQETKEETKEEESKRETKPIMVKAELVKKEESKIKELADDSSKMDESFDDKLKKIQEKKEETVQKISKYEHLEEIVINNINIYDHRAHVKSLVLGHFRILKNHGSLENHHKHYQKYFKRFPDELVELYGGIKGVTSDNIATDETFSDAIKEHMESSFPLNTYVELCDLLKKIYKLKKNIKHTKAEMRNEQKTERYNKITKMGLLEQVYVPKLPHRYTNDKIERLKNDIEKMTEQKNTLKDITKVAMSKLDKTLNPNWAYGHWNEKNKLANIKNKLEHYKNSLVDVNRKIEICQEIMV